MTDNELKQAIICCIRSESCDDCEKMQCPALATQGCIFLSRTIDDREDTLYCEILRDALDLINRQQEEIEKLTINMNAFGLGMKREKENEDIAKAEAVKEFAERLHEYIDGVKERHEMPMLPFSEALVMGMEMKIDKLVKEMVGDTE